MTAIKIIQIRINMLEKNQLFFNFNGFFSAIFLDSSIISVGISLRDNVIKSGRISKSSK